MQGLAHFIPTDQKISYLNKLLKVGFDTLDFGSFVSPKAIPQLADTAEVLAGLDTSGPTKLLAIVANQRGADDAVKHEAIHYLGYPFSISETFQQRNTRRSIADSVDLVKQMLDTCDQHNKELVVYISMGFGNPYGDPWSPEIAEQWVAKMVEMGVKTLAMADTVGSADGPVISQLFENLLPTFPHTTIGAHFHALPSARMEKLGAAYDAGCRRFDVAMLGFGGCPFAKDELVGNISTESLVDFCHTKSENIPLDMQAFSEANQLAVKIFN